MVIRKATRALAFGRAGAFLLAPNFTPPKSHCVLLRWILGDGKEAAEEALVLRSFQLQLSNDFVNSRKEYLKRFKRTFNTDNAKELCAVYSARPETRARYSACLYAPAKAFTTKLFRDHVQLRPRSVSFLSGGAGSGKSVLQNYLGREDRPVVLDGTLSSYAAARADVDFAIQHTRKVRILHVHCPVERALHFAIVRAMKLGRTMSLDALAQTHFYAPETLLRLAFDYAETREVEITVVDNSDHYAPRLQELAFIETIRPKDLSCLKDQLHDAFSLAVKAQERATGKPFPDYLHAGFARAGRKVS